MQEGSWMKDIDDIIDDDCRQRIANALADSEKGIVLVQYLVQRYDISKYNKFIDTWKQYDPSIAMSFQNSLNEKITNIAL